jgi:hypothetical protein
VYNNDKCKSIYENDNSLIVECGDERKGWDVKNYTWGFKAIKGSKISRGNVVTCSSFHKAGW